MAATCAMTSGQWKHPPSYSWAAWQHVMPYVSLEELYVLSQVENMSILVEVYVSSGKLVINGADLRAKRNLEFYKYIGRSATQLVLEDTLEMDIVPILECFPHLQTLTLRRALICQNVTKGFPVKIRKLTLEQCRMKIPFLKKWYAALSETLDSVELINVPEDIAEILISGVQHLRIQDMPLNFAIVNRRLKSLVFKGTKINPEYELNCPSIEYFKYEGGNIKDLNDTLASVVNHSKTNLFKVVLSHCTKVTVDWLLDCPNLKHLTILNPIEEQLDWSYTMRLADCLSTLKCSFVPVPIEVLPNELLARIAGYVDTEDCIALSHVNRKLRSIIFDHVYPFAEMILRTNFKRYPLDRRPYIYKEMGRRVKKIYLIGRGETEILNNIDFPKLTSLDVNTVHFGEATKVPDGLKCLRMYNQNTIATKCDAGFLSRTLPTITDLTCWHSDICLDRHDLSSLREFEATISVPDLVQILCASPNLLNLCVVLGSEGETINELMDAFKFTPNLVLLNISFSGDADLTFDNLIIQKPILPQLKYLQIKYKGEQVHKAISYFLNGICTDNLQTLSVGQQSEEIMRFKNLTTLSILEENCTNVDLVEKLPNLVELNTKDTRLYLDVGMRVIRVLETNNRTIRFNNVILRSYADLLKVEGCN